MISHLYSSVATVAMVLVLSSPAPGFASQTLDNVTGLKERLQIIRGPDHVPHVRAGSEADAIFGLGFVHAQDRLWQLEFLRRLGRGKLAQVLGPAALARDKFFRTLGISQSAEATWARSRPEHKALIRSYVAGLNAATERQRERGLPPEFTILNIQPEPWTPEDVMVTAKVLGWSVDANWDQELLRAQMQQKVGAERGAQLMPAYTADGPVIVAPDRLAQASKRTTQELPWLRQLDARMISNLAGLAREVAETSGFGGRGTGSNNQVLAGARTTTGKPILASDPHLPSQIPAIFYRVHLTGGSLDAIGASVAGLPGIVMGHNGRIAWGWTNANADVQDLYVEKLVDGRNVEYEGRHEPLVFRQEIIRVKDQPDVLLTVRSTRHGPLISDVVSPGGPALALRWAALDSDDDVGIAAYLEANRATNWREFTQAFRRFRVHAQNLLYADAEGNIAYLLAGAIPLRTAGDGTAPVPGWTAAYEWKGYLRFEELPKAFNPNRGFLSSANNKIAPDTYPHVLSNSYAAPYRATRVMEMLQSRSRFAPRDLERMQADVLAAHARELMPFLLTTPVSGKMERQALDVLRRWDYRMTSDSAAAAVFESWYIQVAQALFADELGSELWQTYSDELHMVSMALSSALRNNSEFCDDVTTPMRETCSAIAARALRDGLQRMAAAQGTSDVRAWQWSKVHHAIFFHQPFDADPTLSERFKRSIPNGGDKHTVNVASNPRWTDYNQRHVALYRQIVDFHDLDSSVWMATPGQSGIVSNRHYDDLMEPWQRVEYTRMPFTPAAVEQQALDHVELRP